MDNPPHSGALLPIFGLCDGPRAWPPVTISDNWPRLGRPERRIRVGSNRVGGPIHDPPARHLDQGDALGATCPGVIPGQPRVFLDSRSGARSARRPSEVLHSFPPMTIVAGEPAGHRARCRLNSPRRLPPSRKRHLFQLFAKADRMRRKPPACLGVPRPVAVAASCWSVAQHRLGLTRRRMVPLVTA